MRGAGIEVKLGFSLRF